LPRQVGPHIICSAGCRAGNEGDARHIIDLLRGECGLVGVLVWVVTSSTSASPLKNYGKSRVCSRDADNPPDSSHRAGLNATRLIPEICQSFDNLYGLLGACNASSNAETFDRQPFLPSCHNKGRKPNCGLQCPPPASPTWNPAERIALTKRASTVDGVIPATMMGGLPSRRKCGLLV
jgi:hypothetical protein